MEPGAAPTWRVGPRSGMEVLLQGRQTIPNAKGVLEYGLRAPVFYGNLREKTVFHEYLQEACFALTEISENNYPETSESSSERIEPRDQSSEPTACHHLLRLRLGPSLPLSIYIYIYIYVTLTSVRRERYLSLSL